MEQIKIDIVKQWLKNKKEFSPLEVIETLEKENLDLIDKLNLQNQRLNELKADKEYLDNVNNEQTKVILKLNAQIEKMKCCGNCKHCFSKNDEDNVITCAYDDEFAYLSLRKCEKWECVK